MAADWTPAASLALFEVRFACAGRVGSRQVWAPDADAASDLIRDRASLFGLVHETVEILTVIELEIKEDGLDAAA